MAKTKNFDTGGQVRPDVFLRFGGAGAGLDFQPDESVKAAQGRLENWFKEETTVDPQTLFGGIAALLNLEKGKTVESPSFELGEDITARARLGLNPEDSYMPSHLGGQINFEDIFGEDFDLEARAGWEEGDSSVGLQGKIRFHQGGVIDAPQYPAYKNSEVQSLPLPEGWQPYKNSPIAEPIVPQPETGWQPPGTPYMPSPIPFMAQGGGLTSQVMRPEIYGRGEDSMMMHVTPGEVQGLMSLFPGALTQNPYTGYAEAGGLGDIFKKILPILAIAAITYFTMGAGTGPALAATGGATAGSMGTAAGASGLLAAGASAPAAALIPAASGIAYPAMTGAQMASASAPYASSLGGAAAIPGIEGLSYGMGQQALASPALGAMETSGAWAGDMAAQPLMHSYTSPHVGSQFTKAGSEFMTEKTAPGIDWGDTAKRLAKQAGQQEEEEPPPPPPMPTATVEQGRPAVSMDELLASIPSGQLPERETGGLGLELEDVTDDELIDKLLEEEEEEGITDDELADLLMPGFRKGGPVEGMMVGPSSIIPQGGGLVLGGEMDGDVFKVDGVHTQIYDGGEAVQEARLNNGEVVMSAGAVTGLGKALGASPNEEIQAGADFLMQIQQRGEAMNNGDHKSPTNLRPSYGFGLA